MATVLMPGTRLTVFAIRKTQRGASVWVRTGNAFVNKDASLNVWLDALPIDGQLHVREAVVEKRDLPLPPGFPPPGSMAVPFAEEPVMGNGAALGTGFNGNGSQEDHGAALDGAPLDLAAAGGHS